MLDTHNLLYILVSDPVDTRVTILFDNCIAKGSQYLYSPWAVRVATHLPFVGVTIRTRIPGSLKGNPAWGCFLF